MAACRTVAVPRDDYDQELAAQHAQERKYLRGLMTQATKSAPMVAEESEVEWQKDIGP